MSFSFLRTGCLLATLLTLIPYPSSAADLKFQPPKAEELALKSVASAPGAHAVILQWTEVQDDTLGTSTTYLRIKILTDEGRKYGEIEIPYLRGSQRVSDIRARTIRPDGTIVPFEGNVYDKTILKTRRSKLLAKTFAVPEVTAGSIIEYRYTIAWDNTYLYSSVWPIQRELPILKGLLELKPSDQYAAYFSYFGLPEGVVPVKDGKTYSLTIENVPAFEEEEFAPPSDSLKARVQFVYTTNQFKDVESYWVREGKEWAEAVEDFIGKRSGIKQAAAELVVASDTNEQKLRKIYDRVQKIRNLTYVDDKTEQEEKREKLRDNRHVEDVLRNGYGYQSEINRLYVALARALGFTAEVVRVCERDDRIFMKEIADGRQLNGEVLVVEIDGNQTFLDPGTPNAPYGLLSWEYTGVPGIRLNKSRGGTWLQTPAAEARDTLIRRNADLRIEDDLLKGTVTVSWEGQSAMIRRLMGYEKDAVARKKEIEDDLKAMFPDGSVVELAELTGLDESAVALVAKAKVEIRDAAVSAGTRVITPLSIFQLTAKNPFSAETRRHPLMFNYAYRVEDEVKLSLPEGFNVETAPHPVSLDRKLLTYSNEWSRDGATVVVKRRFSLNGIQFAIESYPAFRLFYGKMLTSDAEKLVLKKGA
ncbi:MAG: DUF3857 and transglutaminase domain-containing protein [Acidobacteria bacterium]|nr:DUF3857 and transglutaminase domain-containing protein [Acidobacteriota bacterium]